MRFTSNFIELVRERVLLSEVIAKKIRLDRKGKEFLGLCPFHNEKTPSFTVNDEKQFYHCFGCGQHGDVIKFISETMGMSFAEAVEKLARDYGIELPKVQQDDNYQKKHDIYEVTELATKWFEQQLLLAKNSKALNYLEGRKINKSIIQKFRLGYAPEDKNPLLEHLKKLGVDYKLAVDAGLIVQNNDKDYYDRFRGRVIFPIIDVRGRVIAFGGRSLNKEVMPKYLNSPETILFKKKEVVYGENLAKEAAFHNKRMIVVEGYIDVIAMHMAGFTETVASLGTALSDFHIQKLWKYCNEPIICFDGDAAGLRAMQKAGELAIGLLKPGFSLNFAALPAGLDPDDLIKHQGTEMMGKILGNAVSLSESLWRHELALLPQKPTPEQKAALEKRLFDIAAKIQDNNVKASYRSYFSGMLWQHIKKPRSTIMDVTNHKTANLNAVASCVISDIERLERTIILIITNYPYLLKDHRIEEEFSLLELSNYELDNLRMQILAIYNENNDINCQNISQSLEKNQFFNDITYWAKQNLSFVNYNHQEGEAANFWQYSLYKYRLSLLEIDYRDNLNQLTQSSMARADEFRKQIILLRNEINKMEHLLDT